MFCFSSHFSRNNNCTVIVNSFLIRAIVTVLITSKDTDISLMVTQFKVWTDFTSTAKGPALLLSQYVPT